MKNSSLKINLIGFKMKKTINFILYLLMILLVLFAFSFVIQPDPFDHFIMKHFLTKKTLILNKREYRKIMLKTAWIVGVDAGMLQAICEVENAKLDAKEIGDKHQKNQAYGLCQIKLATAQGMIKTYTVDDLLDPHKNIFMAALILKQCKKLSKSTPFAINCYNRGLKKSKKLKNPKKTYYVYKFKKAFNRLN